MHTLHTLHTLRTSFHSPNNYRTESTPKLLDRSTPNYALHLVRTPQMIETNAKSLKMHVYSVTVFRNNWNVPLRSLLTSETCFANANKKAKAHFGGMGLRSWQGGMGGIPPGPKTALMLWLVARLCPATARRFHPPGLFFCLHHKDQSRYQVKHLMQLLHATREDEKPKVYEETEPLTTVENLTRRTY